MLGLFFIFFCTAARNDGWEADPLTKIITPKKMGKNLNAIL